MEASHEIPAVLTPPGQDPGLLSGLLGVRVAVAFTSYNRREIALECVRRLRLQTRVPDLVVVADNASEDGSPDALRALGWEALEVIDTGGNVGNAGGVRAAMEHAFAAGADAVWILDDDSWPREDALERLLEPAGSPLRVRHSLQIDQVTGKFTWPLMIEDGNGGWKPVSRQADIPADLVRTRTAWTGALISREVREAVGPVMGELFIRGEDEEYPWRIQSAGIPTEAVRESLLDHPGPAHLVHWSLLGKHLFLEKGLADGKLYYKVRNMVWLKRRQSGFWGALAIMLAYWAGITVIDGPHRLTLLWKASLAGWTGKLGRWAGS